MPNWIPSFLEELFTDVLFPKYDPKEHNPIGYAVQIAFGAVVGAILLLASLPYLLYIAGYLLFVGALNAVVAIFRSFGTGKKR